MSVVVYVSANMIVRVSGALIPCKSEYECESVHGCVLDVCAGVFVHSSRCVVVQVCASVCKYVWLCKCEQSLRDVRVGMVYDCDSACGMEGVCMWS